MIAFAKDLIALPMWVRAVVLIVIGELAFFAGLIIGAIIQAI